MNGELGAFLRSRREEGRVSACDAEAHLGNKSVTSAVNPAGEASVALLVGVAAVWVNLGSVMH